MTGEFVTVATFATLPEAEAARLMLQTEGILVVLGDAETVSMDWLLGNAIGYIKLRVPPAQVENATALLERIGTERRRRRAEPDHAGGEPVSGEIACLACGTSMPEDEHRCPTCGWSYADGRE